MYGSAFGSFFLRELVVVAVVAAGVAAVVVELGVLAVVGVGAGVVWALVVVGGGVVWCFVVVLDPSGSVY